MDKLNQPNVHLRDVIDNDLPIFFNHQQESAAVHMAAFTAEDPSNKEAFQAHWDRIRSSKNILIKTIFFENEVVGHIVSFEQFGKREISYWIGQEFWGKGITTNTLLQFLKIDPTRPLFARAAKDNAASIRVLEKCGFQFFGEDKGFANARREEIEEYILKLDAQ